MRCPKCEGHRCRYNISWARKEDGLRKNVPAQTRKEERTRENFSAKCQDCDWVGEI